MKFININTQRIRQNLPKIPNVFNTNWDNSRSYYTNEGWRELIEADVPNTHRVISTTYVDNGDDTVTEVVETDTIENIVAQAEQERLNNLLATYGDRVSQLAQLLTIFGISLPTTQAEATPIIHEKSKLDNSLLPDAVLVLSVYQELLSHISDEEIYEVYQLLP